MLTETIISYIGGPFDGTKIFYDDDDYDDVTETSETFRIGGYCDGTKTARHYYYISSARFWNDDDRAYVRTAVYKGCDLTNEGEGWG